MYLTTPLVLGESTDSRGDRGASEADGYTLSSFANSITLKYNNGEDIGAILREAAQVMNGELDRVWGSFK